MLLQVPCDRVQVPGMGGAAGVSPFLGGSPSRRDGIIDVGRRGLHGVSKNGTVAWRDAVLSGGGLTCVKFV